MFYTGPDIKKNSLCRSLSQNVLSVLSLAKVVNVHCYSDHPLRYLDSRPKSPASLTNKKK